MKKAIAKVTIMIGRITYIKGTVFTAPYPPGVESEIKSGSGSIVEVQQNISAVSNNSVPEPVEKPAFPGEKELGADDDALDEYDPEFDEAGPEPILEPEVEASVETVEAPGEDPAEKKERLIAEALEKYGVKIGRNKSLATIERQIAILEEEEKASSTAPAADPDLNEI